MSHHIDAVYIASPNAYHAQQAILFMQHGKHVLCEKALAGYAYEAREMFEVARRHGVLLMEAMKTTLSPGFEAVQRALPRIGRVRRYIASYSQYSSRYDRLKQGEVLNAWKPELCNGALMDLGVYTLYPLIALFGKPKRIAAQGILLPTGVDAEGAALLGYDDMQGVVTFSKVNDSYLPTEIQGEEGTIVIDRINSIGEVRLIPRKGKEEVLCSYPDKDEYYYEVKAFLDLIEQHAPESRINTAERSIATLEVMEEIRRQMGVVFPGDRCE